MSACSGAGSADSTTTLPAPTSSDPGPAQVTVDPSGGSVVLRPDSDGMLRTSDGAFEVRVPAGAVEEPVTLTVERIAAADAEGFGDAEPAGDVFRLGPEGLAFSEAVTVVRRISGEEAGFDLSAELPAVFLVSAGADGLELLDDLAVTREDDIVVASGTTLHLSDFAAGTLVTIAGEAAYASIPASAEAAVGETFSVDLSTFPEGFGGSVIVVADDGGWSAGGAGVIEAGPGNIRSGSFTCLAEGSDGYSARVAFVERDLRFGGRRIAPSERVTLDARGERVRYTPKPATPSLPPERVEVTLTGAATCLPAPEVAQSALGVQVGMTAEFTESNGACADFTDPSYHMAVDRLPDGTYRITITQGSTGQSVQGPYSPTAGTVTEAESELERYLRLRFLDLFTMEGSYEHLADPQCTQTVRFLFPVEAKGTLCDLTLAADPACAED